MCSPQTRNLPQRASATASASAFQTSVRSTGFAAEKGERVEKRKEAGGRENERKEKRERKGRK